MKEHSKMVHGANTSGFAARILVSIFGRNIHQFETFSEVAKDVKLHTVININIFFEWFCYNCNTIFVIQANL